MRKRAGSSPVGRTTQKCLWMSGSPPPPHGRAGPPPTKDLSSFKIVAADAWLLFFDLLILIWVVAVPLSCFPCPPRHSPLFISPKFFFSITPWSISKFLSGRSLFLRWGVPFFQFGCVLFPQLFRVIPDSFIQNLLMNPVRAAIAFPVPVVAPADVFHTAAAIPVTDHGTEHVPAFLTGQRPSVGQPGFSCRMASKSGEYPTGKTERSG